MQNAALKAKNDAVRNVADRAKFQCLPRSTLPTLKTLSTRRAPQTATRRPASCRRAVPCPGFVPLAGNDWSAKRGNSRSRRRRPRKFAGRSCAASSLSLNRGRRPPEAEKRARRFSASLLGRKVPRSLLDICTARRAPPKAAARVLRKPPASPPSSRKVRRGARKPRSADEQPPQNATRAEGQTAIQPSMGISLAQAPRRGDSGIGEAF